MDSVSDEQRSYNMSRIKNRDTKPELSVRSLLHQKGFRFRLHRKDLPGNPDIVLPKYNLIIFVHGCFWHRHKACKYSYVPKSRVDFWHEKFMTNIARDFEVTNELVKLGWDVSVIWECQTKKLEVLEDIIERIFQRYSINR